MMKILLPVSLLFMLGDEDFNWFYLVCGHLFMSLVCLLGVVSPYSSVGFLFVDGMSMSLILLTLWISAMMLMVSGNTTDFCGLGEFHSMIAWLSFTLVWAFMASSFFVFYVFFEITLVPITLMILGWGYQPERLQASFYLFVYTVTASLPLLVIIMILSIIGGHVSFFLEGWGTMEFFSVSFLWVFFIVAFLVKTPIYFFHLWLPKAHVESPLAGSMILAGVLLKLGGYGLIRASFIFQSMSYSWVSYWISSLALWGGAICGFICLRQVDIKCLIAYSSITHMGVMIGGILSNTYLGSCGAIMMMFSHGLVSSSMFLGAYMMYKVVGTRMLYLIKGFMSIFPFLSLIWFFSMAANMGAPPSINLFSEVMLSGGVLKMSFYFVPALSLSLFFSAAYSLYLYASTQNGGISSSMSGDYSFISSDCVAMFLHLFPVYLLLLCSGSMFYGLL